MCLPRRWAEAAPEQIAAPVSPSLRGQGGAAHIRTHRSSNPPGPRPLASTYGATPLHRLQRPRRTLSNRVDSEVGSSRLFGSRVPVPGPDVPRVSVWIARRQRLPSERPLVATSLSTDPDSSPVSSRPPQGTLAVLHDAENGPTDAYSHTSSAAHRGSQVLTRRS